ncbi:tetratricopeptide repeat protein [bacterium]|nr:tetratricopeptide repeat protein [bacterium]
MKKVLLLVSILLVAVISTACINNFAVQDLNNKAQTYMQKGDYAQAIERLKSSIDLDPTIFETHYNLAVAYTQSEDYINAVEEYKKAIEIKSDVPEVYYSLATAQNNLIIDLEQGRVRMNVDDSLYTPKAEDLNFDEKYEMSEKETSLCEELKDSALQNYTKYLDLNPNAKNKAEVEKQMEYLAGENKPSDEE